MTAIENLARHGFDDHPLVKAFRRDRVLHDRFQSTLDLVAERIQYGEQQSMTVVIGPTAGGKTALCEEFGYQFELAMNTMPEVQRTSLLAMELAAPEHGTFKWTNDFYIPALSALNEPCATKKINIEQLRERLVQGQTNALFASRPKTIPEWRNVFYAALDRAKAIGAIFDEANHLRRPTTGNGVFGKYDSLKSRSDACKTHFVLVGTIEVADIFKQSGPISKRVYPLWLGPYPPNEKLLFGGAVVSITEKLPIKITFTVEGKLTQLYEGTFGLFGLVHDWFDRALIRAIAKGKSSITWADMEATALHPWQLSGIAADLIKFREVETGVNVYLAEQRKTLLLPPAKPASNDSRTPAAQTAKPFQRKPARDPVAP